MNAGLIEKSHPILTCSDSVEWESSLLTTDEDAWRAMQAAGESLGRALRCDYAISRARQKAIHVLGLVGKGHNGGDALLAIKELASMPSFVASVTLVVNSPLEDLKPNTKRAFELLEQSSPNLTTIAPGARDDEAWLERAEQLVAQGEFHICLDGLLGMQFRPPVRASAARLIHAVNHAPSIRLRAAVDLPSGVGDESDTTQFRADFTYATGILKKPLLVEENSGCIRYLDLGFFRNGRRSVERVLTDQILMPLRGLRPARSEKRKFGHLAVVAGSRTMPGALIMSVLSAISSGVGRVTVFAPESIIAPLAPALPEAMWRSWPETPDGGLALEGLSQIRCFAEKATAMLLGPGMGTERETQTLLCEIASQWNKPAILDADALSPSVIEAFHRAGNEHVVATPHDGEFARLTGSKDTSERAALDYAREKRLYLVKKASATRITDGESLFVNTTGNAVLARGGSGDLLAGLIGGLLAQNPDDPLAAACTAVYWHGKAADRLARHQGQTAARTTDLLDFLSSALEDGEPWTSNYPESRRTGL